jgi:hypothetical protein
MQQHQSRLRRSPTFETVRSMSASAPLQLQPEDKLDALRYLDEFHFWHSLDEERLCERCGRTITGRQILIFEREGTRGAMRLQCPTPGCVSRPGDWVYANPLQAAKLHGKTDSHREAARDNIVAAERIHHGDRSKKARLAGSLAPHGIRAALARLAFLRPIAARLHALHPLP